MVAHASFLTGGGVLSDAIAAYDWSQTPLGPIASWPPELRTACGIMLQAGAPAALWWGMDRTAIYNTDYLTILGERAPALGRPFAQVWPDLVDNIGALFDEIFATAQGVSGFDDRIDVVRGGSYAESFWNYSFVPILGAQGQVLGILNNVRDTTGAVMQRRTADLLLALDNAFIASDGSDAVIDAALAVIGENLGVQRTGFAELAGAALNVRRCWTRGALAGRVDGDPLGMFGEIAGELAQGNTVRRDSSGTDATMSDPANPGTDQGKDLRSGMVTPIFDRGRQVGAVFVQDLGVRPWTDHEAGLVQAATARLWQALVRARAEAGLRESEQRFRLIFEQANDIIFTADLDQRITAANPAGAAALGYAPGDIPGRSIADFVSPADFAQTTAMLDRKLATGGHTRHEVGVTGRDGKAMRWENDSTLIIDIDKRPIGLLSISRDVTERRAFDARRELLIHELNHRVKNTLSLVQGLAQQSFRSGQDTTRAAVDFLARLSALAVAHDLLTRDQWEGATIAELVRGATAHVGERVTAHGPHLLVSPKSAVALVMALHELTTNAVKYGSLSSDDGRVDADWQATHGGQFMLVWRERGGPTVKAPTRRGFGVRMIERVLASDLGGTVTVDFAPQGLVCTIAGQVLA